MQLHAIPVSINPSHTTHTMADKKAIISLARAAKARQAARRIAAKKRAAKMADTTEDLVELELGFDDDDEAGAGAGGKRKRAVPKKSASAGGKKGVEKRKRLRADELKWKTVNTSSLPGMDAGGGMMMLEELEGVGVEWEDGPDGGRTARFVVSPDVGGGVVLMAVERIEEGQGQGSRGGGGGEWGRGCG